MYTLCSIEKMINVTHPVYDRMRSVCVTLAKKIREISLTQCINYEKSREFRMSLCRVNLKRVKSVGEKVMNSTIWIKCLYERYLQPQKGLWLIWMQPKYFGAILQYSAVFGYMGGILTVTIYYVNTCIQGSKYICKLYR